MFVNWLNEDQGYPKAYDFTVNGLQLWEFGDPGFNPENPVRNSLAKFVLPTGHEWHKAAYYDSSTDAYRPYATGDEVPEPVFSTTEAGTAVHGLEFLDGPSEVHEAGGPSPYGAIGMQGNVSEWEEGGYDIDNFVTGSIYRSVRGGNWLGVASSDSFGDRSNVDPTAFVTFGMRTAMVEPSEVVLGDFNRDGAVSQADLDLFQDRVAEALIAKAEGEENLVDHIVWDHANNIMDLDTNNTLDDRDRQLWHTLDQSSPGDSDLDGDVDFVDFLSLANNFGQSPSSWSQGDYDGNNETNFLDFLALANNFGNAPVAAAAASVPEPSSSLLAVLALTPFLLTRKRRCA